MTTSKRNTSAPRKTPATEQPNLARIHDLTNFAAVSIPPELRQILGEKEYERHIQKIENHEIVMIIRVPNHVVYLRSRLMTVPLDGQKEVQVPDRNVSKANSTGKAAVAPASKSGPKRPTKLAPKTRGQA